MTDAAMQATETTTAAPAGTTTVPDDQADKDFEAGFSGAPSQAPAVQPQEKKPAAEAQPTQPAGDAKAPAAAAGTGEAAAAKPGAQPTLHFGKYTEEQVQALFAKVAEVDDVRTQLAEARDQIKKMSGAVGNALQLMKTSGQPVKVGKDLLKKLNENGYGELAELLADDLSEILKASVVPGTTDFDVTAFQTAVDQKVATALDGQSKTFEKRLLGMSHPDWADIYASPDFKVWKATHPADVQNLLDTSWDSEFLAKGLSAFKKWRDDQAKAKKDADAASSAQRNKRLEAAVQPTKGQGTGNGQQPPTDDELFEQGFKEARTQG